MKSTATRIGVTITASTSRARSLTGAMSPKPVVVIDHGNGWQSAYGHLSRITVAKGDTVTDGERIGLGGQGGEAERPELHFEIRHGGEPVDPAPLLRLERD